jgi:hypothetical protein
MCVGLIACNGRQREHLNSYFGTREVLISQELPFDADGIAINAVRSIH